MRDDDSDDIQLSQELANRIANGKVKILRDPEHEHLVLIEVPADLPPEKALAIREIDGKRFYTAFAYTAPKEYFIYVNDSSLPTFPDQQSAAEFIRKTAVCLQTQCLVQLWNNFGMVHESITSLTHAGKGTAFTVVWSDKLTDGVTSCDSYVREFNKGIKYPNVGLGGLRDFAHLRPVLRQANLPRSAVEMRNGALKHGIFPIDERTGYGVFTRSIAEVLMVAVHGALVRKAPRLSIAPAVKSGLIDVLRENGSEWHRFSAKWDTERICGIVEDVESALVSDQLRIQRLVRAAELFVLAFAGWL